MLAYEIHGPAGLQDVRPGAAFCSDHADMICRSFQRMKAPRAN
jgi:hypothetical protein